MKTLAVLSRKGGSGKTTVSLSLALAARQAGLKAVLADIDPLHSAAEVLRSRSEGAGMLVETTGAKLFVLQDACRRNGCDLLIIDTPPAPEGEIILAINASDLCLAVARPATLDVAAVTTSLDLIRRMGSPGLVVLNQCPPLRGGVEPQLVELAAEQLRFGGLPLAQARLRSRVAYQHAFAHSRAVTEWDPGSEAAADVLRLLAEISGHLMLPNASRQRPGERPTAQRAAPPPAPLRLMQSAFARLNGPASDAHLHA